MFKKIEIWILYLVLVFTLVSYIFFGALVLREYKGGYHIPIVSHFSKVALFLAEIPSNIKKIILDDLNSQPLRLKILENKFEESTGFSGHPLNESLYLMLSRYDGNLKKSIVELVDLNDFNILHKWYFRVDEFWKSLDRTKDTKWENIDNNQDLSRYRALNPLIDEFGSIITTNHYSPLLKIDMNSNLSFIKDDMSYHHSIEEDHEKNYWVCVKYYPFKIDTKYVGNHYDNYRDDGIRKISDNGEILYDKSISNLLIENNMDYLIFSNTDDFKSDPIHLNDIQPVLSDGKYMKKGDVFISLRNLSMIILFRPSTNKIIWISENGNFLNQHDVDILDSERISILDNNMRMIKNGRKTLGNNKIVIYNFRTKSYTTFLEETFNQYNIKTNQEGVCEILPNGDVFFEETLNGRILYFNSDGSLRWMYVNKSDDGDVYYTSWSRILYEQKDIQKVRSFLNDKIEVTQNE